MCASAVERRKRSTVTSRSVHVSLSSSRSFVDRTLPARLPASSLAGRLRPLPARRARSPPPTRPPRAHTPPPFAAPRALERSLLFAGDLGDDCACAGLVSVRILFHSEFCVPGSCLAWRSARLPRCAARGGARGEEASGVLAPDRARSGRSLGNGGEGDPGVVQTGTGVVGGAAVPSRRRRVVLDLIGCEASAARRRTREVGLPESTGGRASRRFLAFFCSFFL